MILYWHSYYINLKYQFTSNEIVLYILLVKNSLFLFWHLYLFIFWTILLNISIYVVFVVVEIGVCIQTVYIIHFTMINFPNKWIEKRITILKSFPSDFEHSRVITTQQLYFSIVQATHIYSMFSTGALYSIDWFCWYYYTVIIKRMDLIYMTKNK